MKNFRHQVESPFPCQKMYELVVDVPAYPQFVPYLQAASCQTRRDGLVSATLDIRYKGFGFAFTTVNRNRPFCSIQMETTKPPFKQLSGSWTFTPITGDRSLVELHCSFEIKSIFLRHISSSVFDFFAKKMVESFVRRAYDKYS